MSSWACSDHSGRLCGFRCRVQPEFSVRQCEFLRCEFPAGLRWLRRADTESQGNVSVQRASRRYRERGESRCFCDLRHRLDARAYDRDACAHGGADLRHRGSAHDHHLWRQVRHHAGGDARAPPEEGAALADALLRVQVAVARQGSKCEDMYIKVLNVTGSWAEEKHVGGFSFVTESPAGGQVIAAPAGSADWSRLGMVDLKVVRGATRSGVLYLNMFARHLRDASRVYPIGGILGLDDHGEAATPAAECGKKVLSLLHRAHGLGALDGGSVADASA
ncbi:unnamed protein product [Prorocentrum cordatum]|uniref:Uncharacterized protein n=1 Tax=Prorocentrum cordatum TaxID=2364126 RepID=A0ABN9UL06_9DINO|nr:unnamed protein product [Polarella glacialis]